MKARTWWPALQAVRRRILKRIRELGGFSRDDYSAVLELEELEDRTLLSGAGAAAVLATAPSLLPQAQPTAIIPVQQTSQSATAAVAPSTSQPAAIKTSAIPAAIAAPNPL